MESADSTSDLQYSHPSGWTSGRPFVFLSPSASETLCRWRPQFSVTHPPLPCVLSGEGGASPAESCVRRAPLCFLLLPTIISFPSYQRISGASYTNAYIKVAPASIGATATLNPPTRKSPVSPTPAPRAPHRQYRTRRCRPDRLPCMPGQVARWRFGGESVGRRRAAHRMGTGAPPCPTYRICAGESTRPNSGVFHNSHPATLLVPPLEHPYPRTISVAWLLNLATTGSCQDS